MSKNLSQKNYDSLDTDILYRKEPDYNKDWLGGIYHCRNWTFRAIKRNHDGSAFMRDTYWSSGGGMCIEITDNNICEFEVVFNFTDVRQISDYEIDEYEKDDLYRTATNSGGYSCGHLHWVKKDAKKSQLKLIIKCENEIKTHEFQLKGLKRVLNQLTEKAN